MIVDCLCPPLDGDVRHPDGDTITLRQKLDFRSAMTMQKAIVILRSEVDEPTSAEILACLSEAYLLHGVETWTVVDDKGKPVPVNSASVREYLLSDVTASMAVAEEADDLYQPVVLLPLLERGSTSSATSRTRGSTSRATGSQPEPRRLSRRSSTSTTPTDATEATSSSRDGDSSSSLSSASAA